MQYYCILHTKIHVHFVHGHEPMSTKCTKMYSRSRAVLAVDALYLVDGPRVVDVGREAALRVGPRAVPQLERRRARGDDERVDAVKGLAAARAV